MAGASGGALAALFAGCAVDADQVLEVRAPCLSARVVPAAGSSPLVWPVAQSAYELSLAHDIWDRPLGLLGVWGGIIEHWLDELLPANAVELCQDRVELIVTTLPGMEQVRSRRFRRQVCHVNAAHPQHRRRSALSGSWTART
jgi:hypothetical protein